jgi:hypothetical protein
MLTLAFVLTFKHPWPPGTHAHTHLRVYKHPWPQVPVLTLTCAFTKTHGHRYPCSHSPACLQKPMATCTRAHTHLRVYKNPWPQVPVLFDKKTQKIVNNESSQILRMFETEFATLGKRRLDLYPVSLRDEIDELNAWIYQVRTHLSASPAPSHTHTHTHTHTATHARARTATRTR